MEMMRHDAGVRSVVVGGRPNYGPMQTPSGSRGARHYDLESLSIDVMNAFGVAEFVNQDVEILGPLNYSSFFYYTGGVSLRAQVREGETVPLAMQFEAADCRIFWTPETFNNFTNLWKYADAAATTLPELCVQGSTGYAGGHSANPPPDPPHLAPVVNYTSAGTPSIDLSDSGVPLLVIDGPMPDAPGGLLPSTAARQPTAPGYHKPLPQGLTPAAREAQKKKIQRLQKQKDLKNTPYCGFSGPLCSQRLRRREPRGNDRSLMPT